MKSFKLDEAAYQKAETFKDKVSMILVGLILLTLLPMNMTTMI